MKQPGGGSQENTGLLTPTEIALERGPMEITVERGTWKSLLDNMHFDDATHDLKGVDEAYNFASRNALGEILVFTRFLDPETKAFAR
jgi:hypothetical protein